ncbi:AI-2E family transporter [Paraburkholderia dinghuensis]|uniref:AI-2E family transporter n=1 Tax=Paraburkholderia dinghuensis TaxID=2305225 RepID=A0A3N6N8W6_9BURK|nr:AI-2E family transporter [Paraburkholderia dinghuensis]RQH04587.1 AI-2E family transporter [Paraburkholderia dinghuensis]
MVKRSEATDEKDVRDLPPRPVRLTSNTSLPKLPAVEIGSYLVAASALLAVLYLNLLGALLAGMLVYQLVHIIAPYIERSMSSQRARWASVVLVSIVIVGVLTGLTVGVIEHFEDDVPSVQKVMSQMMVFVDQARGHIPAAVAAYLPVDVDQLKVKVVALMHEHADQLGQGGKNAARIFGRIVIGMIIGAIVAISMQKNARRLPLSNALVTRVARFADAFRRIVFAQVKISAINTAFTGIFLLLILPIFHSPLPLAKMLVAVTFIVGLLPVIGNLISNTLIVAVALTVGLPAAITALVFLIVIHKLEYFLNARIVGGQIEARTWELLVAMLVMESAFGIQGVIAAPIFYAYIKRELIYLRLV